ncbi:MAG: hypothetical protein V3W41_22075 [Planctomycetota bacterium]
MLGQSCARGDGLRLAAAEVHVSDKDRAHVRSFVGVHGDLYHQSITAVDKGLHYPLGLMLDLSRRELGVFPDLMKSLPVFLHSGPTPAPEPELLLDGGVHWVDWDEQREEVAGGRIDVVCKDCRRAGCADHVRGDMGASWGDACRRDDVGQRHVARVAAGGAAKLGLAAHERF